MTEGELDRLIDLLKPTKQGIYTKEQMVAVLDKVKWLIGEARKNFPNKTDSKYWLKSPSCDGEAFNHRLYNHDVGAWKTRWLGDSK